MSPSTHPKPIASGGSQRKFLGFFIASVKTTKKKNLLSARILQKVLFRLTILSTNSVAQNQNKRGVQMEPTRNRSKMERDEYSWQYFGCI